MKYLFPTLLFISALAGCLHSATDFDEKQVSVESTSKVPRTIPRVKPVCSMHDTLRLAGLVNIQEVNPNIKVNLRYSGINNFLKQDLYGCVDSAFMQQKTATMLSDAQNKLTAMDSTLHLMIWDAVRPRSVQWKMWEALDMPFDQKIKYVSNPKNGSLHNYGCAIDLTICYANGDILNMGTDFDFFGRAAHASNEYLMVNDGTINFRQLDNRKLLRNVMTAAGFSTISSEWWHYNAISRPEAKARYAIVN